MTKFRALLQIVSIIAILLSLMNIINPYIGFPVALVGSLGLDFTYVFEYYKNGETSKARKHIYYMIIFLALLLFMLYFN